jgi:hypothetical protein
LEGLLPARYRVVTLEGLLPARYPVVTLEGLLPARYCVVTLEDLLPARYRAVTLEDLLPAIVEREVTSLLVRTVRRMMDTRSEHAMFRPWRVSQFAAETQNKGTLAYRRSFYEA